ncbi:hypothetical protein BRCON_2829 [Candidatus Sumerlaea chitinivorans]|uniref:Uncharacterized protein n=1 Tax=Sumerlaea chitinivorans TaxID=2250252 RepID=A0A2Z4Y8L0_SUMC1|nr:hypothetical protein BRCON_2829 [Candidatus Sumerlaea chitinivorans]
MAFPFKHSGQNACDLFFIIYDEYLHRLDLSLGGEQKINFS